MYDSMPTVRTRCGVSAQRPGAQTRAEKLGALAIVLPWWIHRRNPNQLSGEVHELVSGLFDSSEHAIDGIRVRHARGGDKGKGNGQLA